MRPKLTLAACAILALVLIKFLSAQQQEHSQAAHDMSSMDGMDMQHDGASGEQGINAATQMMSSHHMDMGPHMKMTELRPLQDGDQRREDSRQWSREQKQVSVVREFRSVRATPR